ncbi:TetR/AcrR family transcriptional regulator [Blastococcus sp. CT_GayMR20]|uniref:TetR/AcrR family transcriptional regulator n=1 Tax=Blastococcus sp. CT_GayMR20 TaxID=2559609 RepID=UPI00107468F9|nr:TetR/AcrR family transcriptional regulator [Blastococcus sp. CT_GayMR20]TFV92795.1 TetR/AcrR family transcriptional regulator [Blastococcus sp. CT_GayMR20]TFV92868.1 TetR/AcrR family transcriptional regulator [Blastococcus sp. CT_GayMR20]
MEDVGSDGGKSAPVRRRAVRREAVENRARLLQAAREVFAQRGPDARVEEIAQAAGVGMGTFYRNFTTRQALVDELVADVRHRLLELARRARGAQDGTGLERLLRDAGRAQARDPGYMQFLWSRSTVEQAAVDEFLVLLADLLADAQEAGRIRPDLAATDVWMTLWSLRGILEMTRTAAPRAWQRHVDLMIAGLRARPDGDVGLTTRPMTVTQARRCIQEASH